MAVHAQISPLVRAHVTAAHQEEEEEVTAEGEDRENHRREKWCGSDLQFHENDEREEMREAGGCGWAETKVFVYIL